ncbi:MAG: hypothetical protein KAR31_02325, partial [Candidatus Omnitrophica bacterium]|nr:hypothetical protein [Candidatus Omnitrophota bacterium]
IFLSKWITLSASNAFAADNSAIASEGLLDVRAPVYFPANYFLLLSILFLVLIAGLVAFIYLKRKQKDKTKDAPVDTRLPWEIAFDQLMQLEQSVYLQEGQFKAYYSELSGIIRYYFENRFRIRAPEMTSEEFLWSLEKSRDLKTDQKETLKKFMISCDIIKFAKHIPRVEEAEESFQFARQLVEETKIVGVDQNSANG